MTTYSTKIHTNDANAPSVTNLVAHCLSCGVEWQVRSENGDDAKACAFCGAGSEAIIVVSEAPNRYGEVVR